MIVIIQFVTALQSIHYLWLNYNHLKKAVRAFVLHNKVSEMLNLWRKHFILFRKQTAEEIKTVHLKRNAKSRCLPWTVSKLESGDFIREETALWEGFGATFE